MVDAGDFTHVRVHVTATMDGFGAGCPTLLEPEISIVGGTTTVSEGALTTSGDFDIDDGYTNATYTFTAYFTAHYFVGDVRVDVECEQQITIDVLTCD